LALANHQDAAVAAAIRIGHLAQIIRSFEQQLL
jgi:hypothetical protein